jgi:hypothetical protein
MQTKALAGNQASETATRGSVWRQDATVITAKVQPNRKEVAMFDDRWGDSRDRDHDPRDVDVRDREPVDPRDVFMQDLDLPRSDERERVHDRDRDYRLRESETRTLSTVGAFVLCPRAICGTTTVIAPIRAQATFGVCATRG